MRTEAAEVLGVAGIVAECGAKVGVVADSRATRGTRSDTAVWKIAAAGVRSRTAMVLPKTQESGIHFRAATDSQEILTVGTRLQVETGSREPGDRDLRVFAVSTQCAVE